MAPNFKLALCVLASLSGLVASSPDEPLIAERATTCPASVARTGCLTTEQALSVISRWSYIFNLKVGGEQLQDVVNCTTATNIYTYDKTYTFGHGGKGLLYDNRVMLYNQQNTAYKERSQDPIQEGAYGTVYHIHNCDVITWRWMFNGTTSGIPGPPEAYNKVKGKPVLYYGTDILFIEPDSLRIMHVVTSGDWYNMFLAIGKSFDGTAICPNTKKSTANSDNPAPSTYPNPLDWKLLGELALTFVLGLGLF